MHHLQQIFTLLAHSKIAVPRISLSALVAYYANYTYTDVSGPKLVFGLVSLCFYSHQKLLKEVEKSSGEEFMG